MHRPYDPSDQLPHASSVSLTLPHWKHIFKVEREGVRTAFAAIVPLLTGQALGYPMVGLMIGLGGLYTAIADKYKANWKTLSVAALGISFATFCGSLGGKSPQMAILLLFFWAFVGGMMTLYGNIAGNLGYITTLVLAVNLGLPAGLIQAADRSLEFLAGGAWAILITLLLWHRTGPRDEVTLSHVPSRSRPLLWVFHQRIRKMTRNLTFRSELFHHALRVAVVAAISVALYKLLKFEHGYWLTITVLVIMKPELADTRKRAHERIVGSIVGGTIAVVLAATVRNIILLDVLIVLFSVLAYSHLRHSYSLYVIFLTPFIVLMIDLASPGDWQIALTRVFNTLAGGLLALLAGFLMQRRARAPRRSAT